MNRKLPFLVILLICSAAQPTVLHHFTRDNETERRVILTSNISLKLFHPFKVFQGKLIKPTGELYINPKKLSHGILFFIEAYKTRVEAITKGAAGPLAAALESHKNAIFQFRSGTFETMRHVRDDADNFVAVFRDYLINGEIRTPSTFALQCRRDDHLYFCQVQSEVSLTELGFQLPTRFFIPANDYLQIEGDLTFGAPKEVSNDEQPS